MKNENKKKLLNELQELVSTEISNLEKLKNSSIQDAYLLESKSKEIKKK